MAKRGKKPSAGDPFVDYFSTPQHVSRLEAAFLRTAKRLARTALPEDTPDDKVLDGSVDDANIFAAVSEAQGIAAAVAHFYKVMGLTANGAAYFKGLAADIENGKIVLDKEE